MEFENKPKNYSTIVKVAVFGVALIITGTIVFQGNFLEGVLKLIGAGASEIQEIVISRVDEFKGEEGDWWINNNVKLENIAVVNTVSSMPEDPALTGFLVPVVGVSIQQVEVPDGDFGDIAPENILPFESEPVQEPNIEPTVEPDVEPIVEPEVKEYIYTSPVMDIGGGSTLRSFTTLDYRPRGSGIVYAYRTGATANLSGSYTVIEETSASSPYPNSQFIEHIYLQELPIPQYMQFQITFLNVNPDDLSAVAEFRVAYQLEESDIPVSTTLPSTDIEAGDIQLAKEIILDYNELSITNNEKGLVRINVAANGREVAKLDEVILSKRPRVVFEDIELRTGEQYVVVLETPSFDRKIMYFAASYNPEDKYEFTFGRFYPSAEDETSPSISNADMNGDGAINSIDYSLFLKAFEGANSQSLDF